MGRHCARIGRLALIVWALSVAGVSAQSGPQNASSPPNIVLGSTSGGPGDSVVVPIYFTPPTKKRVNRLDLAVTFVSQNVKFDKLDKGIAAEIGNLDVHSDLSTASNEKGIETSTINITASAPSDATEGVTAGLLAYINLKISKNARPANISLTLSVKAVAPTEIRPGDLQVAGATVEVLTASPEPAVSCFFFTH